MADQPYMGAIFMFAGSFAPRGYMLCQGQLLSIAQNAALFSILGTTYGGDGSSTFALPNLQGRAAVQQGQGAGLQPVSLGQVGGAQSVTLTTPNLPAHSHTVACDSGGSGNTDPTNGYPGNTGLGQLAVYSPGPPNSAMNPGMIGNTGGNAPVNVQNPYLGLNFIIAVQGIYPSRN